MSRVVAAINPVLPGLARRKGVAHHPHGGSFATWTLTLAIRLVWLGPVAAERAVAEDARARVGVEPGQSSGGPSLLDRDVIVHFPLGHLVRCEEGAAAGPSVSGSGGPWAE